MTLELPYASGALLLGQPNQPKCPNQFTPESTLFCAGAVKSVLQISEQAVIVQFGIRKQQGAAATAGNILWGVEEVYLPLTLAIGRNFDGVRVRNFIEGKEAQVILNPVYG